MLQELTELETDYWYEVDHNYGRQASAFYVSDGVFAIGPKAMKGREAVAEFYRWRENRGVRTARHVVTNFRMLSHVGDKASFCCDVPLCRRWPASSAFAAGDHDRRYRRRVRT
jgi:hypothetical protein